MEAIRPSSDLRNKYPELARLTKTTKEAVYITVNGREDTVLMSYAQYGQMKAELELFAMLSEAQNDVDSGRVAPIKDTFDDIRRNLLARRQDEISNTTDR